MNNDTYETAKKQLQETTEWMANASNSKLMVSRSSHNDTRRILFDGSSEIGNAATNDSSKIKERIAACREAYENSGIIGNAVDLMIDFALEGFSIIHENKAIQRFYWRWANQVGLGQVLGQILKSYFIDGNVPVLEFKGQIASKEVNKFKKVTADSANAQKFFTNFDTPKKRVIPYRYSVLDILELNIDGSELLGNLAYQYRVSTENKNILKEGASTEAATRLREALGDETFNKLAETGKLDIDPSRISLLYYKKDSFKRWSNPMLWRIIDDLKFKKLLRDMDVSVTESVINALVIIKLGNTIEGYPPTKEMFEKLANLLATPSKSQYFIWNDLIDIQSDYPPIEKILGAEKYEQVDNDIRSGLGISEVLLNGAGENFSNSFLSVKTLLERLEGARMQILDWLQMQMRNVAIAMDFRKPAWVKMRHMSLTDEEAEKRMMIELVDRGMISYRTCVERFGENPDIEIQRMKDEDIFRRKNEKKFPYVLIKTGKYGPSLSSGPTPFLDLLDSEVMDQRQTQDAKLIRERQEIEMKQLKNPPKPVAAPAQKPLPTAQGPQGDKGGRPSATKKPQKKSQTPRNKPKGQKIASSLQISSGDVENGKKIFDKLYNIFSESVSNPVGENKLTTKHKNHLIYTNISKIIGKFSNVSDITTEKIERYLAEPDLESVDLATAPPKLDRCVKEVVRKMIQRFNKKNKREPNKKERRDIISSAFAICRKSTGL